MEPCTRWDFAGFEIDTAAGVLRRGEEPVKIGGQAFRALALLVSRQGALVGREELQKQIWGDRVHGDFEHGLNVCIRQVRLALADHVEGSPIVLTCPREGYRLAVPVTPLASPGESSAPVEPPAPHAVTLRRPIWRRWHGVAASLLAGVALAAAFSLTRGATTGGAAAVPSTTAAGPPAQPAGYGNAWPTGSSDAYAWYWRGRGYYDRTTGRRPAWALPYFETAVALDPNFALAHASLAVSYLDRAATGVSQDESLVKAKQAADRAVALGPHLAETHVALAELSYRLDRDIELAQREFQRALELNDRNAYARQRYAAFLHEQQRFDEALEQLYVARNLDPLSVMTNWQMANELYYSGRYDAAMVQANRTLELDPSHSWSFRTLGQCHEEAGRIDEAIAAYLKAGQVALGHLGRAYAIAGRTAEARDLLESLVRQPVDGTAHNGVAIALIHTGLGEHAKAMEWLERTRRDGLRLPFSLRIAPQWDALRASQSYPGLVKNGSKGS